MEKKYWVYILASKKDGVLYTGVTNDAGRRSYEHISGIQSGFTKKYNVKKLVYLEEYVDIRDALQREKTLKHWKREWKIALIEKFNPEWNDLFQIINA